MTRAGGSARAAAVGALVLGADQLSKAVVRASIERGEVVELVAGVGLVNARNRGIAFGLFSGAGPWLAVIVAIAMLVLVATFVSHADTPLAWLPGGLLLGGALGNLVDRVREGAVVDFIDPVAWPAFNLADSAIVIGVLGLLYVVESRPTPG